jgi:uncharacterized membrane protein YfcA
MAGVPRFSPHAPPGALTAYRLMSLTISGTEIGTIAILVCFGALLAGGLVKGTIGVGLPMVALPLLSTAVSLRDTIAILYVSVLVTNIWQAFRGGYFVQAFQRFWPMMLAVIVGAWFGSKTLVAIDPVWLTGIVGATVAFFSLINLLNPKLSVPARHETWLSVLIGLTGGFFGGLTLFIGPAIIMFLVALQVKKEEFIGTIGLVYLLGVGPTGVFYVIDGTFRGEHIIPSLLAAMPVVLGMLAGQHIRQHVNEEVFRKLLLIALVLIGFNMIRTALF